MERMATVLRGLAEERGEELPFRGHDRPRRRGRGRRLRVLRDPGRPARGPRGRRVGPALDRRARAGDDRPRRHLLRAAHDPGDGRARRDDRRAGAERLADQLHQPGRAWSPRPSQQVLGDRVVGICDSPSGLCRRVARALGLRPEQMWFDYFGLNHLGWLKGAHDAERDRLPELLADDDAARRLRGGPPVRRRLAARARDDPERVPLLLLRGRGRRHGRAARAAPTCSSRRRRSTRRTGRTPPRRWRPGAPPAPSATAPTWPAERLAAGVEADHDDGDDGGGYEGEAMAVVEAIANNTRAIMILNTANRSRAAVPRRARRRRGALHRRPHRPGAGRGRRPSPRTRRRWSHDQGRRAHDDRGRAHRFARAGRPGARAAPAGAERRPPRARSSTGTASACPSSRSASR